MRYNQNYFLILLMALQILVNNELVDLSADADVSIKVYKRLFDIKDITKKGGDFTLGLELPKTTRNKYLLKHIDEVDLAQSYKNLTPQRCQVIVDGETVLLGTLYIDSVKPTTFECTILGENINYLDIIGDKSIKELTNWRECLFSGVYCTANPQPNQYTDSVGFWDIWNDDGTLYDFQCPLISFGNFPQKGDDVPLTSPFLPDKYTYEYPQLFTQSSHPLAWTELRPAPYLVSVVATIFKDAGYEVAGDFFTDSFFKKLILPDVNPEKGVVADGWNWGVLGRLHLAKNFAVLPEFRSYQLIDTPLVQGMAYQVWNEDNFGLANTLERYSFGTLFKESLTPIPPNTYNAGRYIIPKDGRYRFKYRVVVNTPAVGKYSVILGKFRGDSIQDPSYPAGFWDYTIPTATLTGALSEYKNIIDRDYFTTAGVHTTTFDIEADCLAGDEVVPMLVRAGGFTSVGVFDTGSMYFQVEPLFDYSLNPANFLPDIRQKDFLKYVLTTFNIWVDIEEESKTAFFTTFNNFFQPPQNCVDWTNKCNLKEAEISPTSGFKAIKFGYKDDDKDVNLPTPTKGLIYPLEIDLNNTYFTEVKDITSPFSPTVNINTLIGRDTNLNNLYVSIPTLTSKEVLTARPMDLYGVNIAGEAIPIIPIRREFKPRILYWEGLKIYPVDFSYNLWVGGENLTLLNFQYTGAYPTVDNTVPIPTATFDLNFEPYEGKNLRYTDIEVDGVVSKGLYNRYWFDYVNRNLLSILVKLDVNLDAVDIRQANPRRYIKIGSQLFILNLIDGYELTEKNTTSVELIKLN